MPGTGVGRLDGLLTARDLGPSHAGDVKFAWKVLEYRTCRPRNAASCSIAVAVSWMGCGSVNRPARDCVASWSRTNVNAR